MRSRKNTVYAAAALFAVVTLGVAPEASSASGKLDVFLSGIKTLEQRGESDRVVENIKHVVIGNGYVSVDMISDDVPSLERALRRLGAENIVSFGSKVGALVPLSALGELERASGLLFARPAFAIANANGRNNNGRAISQGDRSMRTDEVRSIFGVTGQGLSIGVLSDSFACNPGPFGEGQASTTAAQDIGRDLPPVSKIDILQDLTGLKVSSVPQGCGSDEGRAMMQLIHDVAPLAAQSFHTAFISEADFALGILELADAGADVIVDDIIYFAEPMFQNGIVAQAANTVNAEGVSYFSSAGNRDRDSYQDEFRPVTEGLLTVHDFDPGPDVDTTQSLTVTATGFTVFSFQWDEPFFSASGTVGSASDLDVFWYDADGLPVPNCLDPAVGLGDTCQFTGDPNVGLDAVDLAALFTVEDVGEEFQIQFILRDGPAPNIVKYVDFDATVPREWATFSPTTFGHNNAEGANAIGAAFALFTEEFPEFQEAFGVQDLCDPACLNGFSSQGGVPLIFNDDGSRKATPIVGEKPVVTGPDGTNTTFFTFDTIDNDGIPNFFGTSAAAPHVAALAILMLDGAGGSGSLMPSQVTSLLSDTAQDIRLKAFFGPPARFLPPGFDFDSGYGFVDGVALFNEMDTQGLLD